MIRPVIYTEEIEALEAARTTLKETDFVKSKYWTMFDNLVSGLQLLRIGRNRKIAEGGSFFNLMQNPALN